MSMTARERVAAAINHRQPDRVPMDFGATLQTGINASVLYRLREALGLDKHPVRICSIMQMLADVEPDLAEALGVDAVALLGTGSSFGVTSIGEQALFTMPDGTPTLMHAGNSWDKLPDGSIVIYPFGDRTAPPSGKMPSDGYYFDVINRAEPFDEDNLTPVEDFEGTFPLISEQEAAYLERESKRLYEQTEYAVIGTVPGTNFGDIARVLGPSERYPKGIRGLEDWMMAHVLFPEYIEEVFKMQLEAALKNLEIYRQAVGDRVLVVCVGATDFGTQNGPLFSLDVFRRLYKPYYKKINDWIHENTSWKTFYHSCGSISVYLDDFMEMGVDILNPVQCSAKGMDTRMLKDKYGKHFTFWGGGIDTQSTLPFGTEEEIKRQVKERLEIFSKGGGYVFNAVHNIAGRTPVANFLAMIDAFREYNGLPPLNRKPGGGLSDDA
jgi:hypothetical protein